MAGWSGLLGALILLGLLAVLWSDDSPSSVVASGPPFEIVGVRQNIDRVGEIHLAVDDAELLHYWTEMGFYPAMPSIDFDQYFVLIYSRADDWCTPYATGVEVHDGLLELQWHDAPSGLCSMGVNRAAVAVAIHRGIVPTSFTAYLPARPPYYEDVHHSVALPAYSGPMPLATRAPVPAPTNVEAVFELPEVGAANLEYLEDGTPLWIVRHHDSSISVLGADIGELAFTPEHLAGLRTDVAWVPAARVFRSMSVYDEFGVHVMGRAGSGVNLDQYEAELVGREVHVGRRLGPVPASVPAAPMYSPAEERGAILPYSPDDFDVLQLEHALTLPDGAIALVTASVVAFPGRDLQLCDAPDTPELYTWSGCDDTAPVIADVGPHTVEPGELRIWLGPVRIRVSSGQPTEVTTLGSGSHGWTIRPADAPQ